MKNFSLGLSILLIPFFGLLFSAQAQPFSLVENYSQQLFQVSSGCAVWADFNHDQNPDVFISGSQGDSSVSGLFLNTGSAFELMNFDFIPLKYCNASWCDFNNDNFPDIFLMGLDENNEIQCRIYQNDGNESFIETDPGIIGTRNGSSCWGDLNNDGLQDLILVGDKGEGGVTRVYRNMSGGQFSIEENDFPQIFAGDVDLGDYNKDYLMDVLLIGKYLDDQGLEHKTLSLFRNDGDFQFTPMFSGFIGMSESNVRWGDYDADGDLDMLANGSTEAPTHLVYLYQNMGDDAFLNIGIEIFGTVEGSVNWGDYDNDGDLDFLLTGKPSNASNPITAIYRNLGINLFNQEPNQNITAVYQSSSSWCDFDQDGDLDAIVSGLPAADSMGITALFQNENTAINQLPEVPLGLSSICNDQQVLLSWLASADAETPALNLTYNVRVGTSEGANDVLSSLSKNSGERLIWDYGNVGLSTSYLLRDLPAGTYYWNVQALDNNFAASPFSASATFTIGPLSLNAELLSHKKQHLAFPNPFKSHVNIYIDYKFYQEHELRIYDMFGELIFNKVLSKKILPNSIFQWEGLDLTGKEIPPGIYWVVIKVEPSGKINAQMKVLKIK